MTHRPAGVATQKSSYLTTKDPKKEVQQMPETKPKRRPPANKRTVPGKTRAADPARAVERTTELSEAVLRDLEDGASSALDAVRKFTETVDKALPPDREGRSRAEEITDSALEMAQRLVHTQAEFLRKVVDSAGSSLGGSRKAKNVE